MTDDVRVGGTRPAETTVEVGTIGVRVIDAGTREAWATTVAFVDGGEVDVSAFRRGSVIISARSRDGLFVRLSGDDDERVARAWPDVATAAGHALGGASVDVLRLIGHCRRALSATDEVSP